jgi:hypothetical protein
MLGLVLLSADLDNAKIDDDIRNFNIFFSVFHTCLIVELREALAQLVELTIGNSKA